MEHLNYKQFNFNAPMMHWDRRNYYSREELKQMWTDAYNRAQGQFKTLTPEQRKQIESIHQRPD